jgi:hypothetical protein
VHILMRVTGWDAEDPPSAAGERGQERERDVAEAVVRLAALGEVVARVADDFFGAERPHQLHAVARADCGDVGAEGPGELQAGGADRSRAAVDEHALAAAQPRGPQRAAGS